MNKGSWGCIALLLLPQYGSNMHVHNHGTRMLGSFYQDYGEDGLQFHFGNCTSQNFTNQHLEVFNVPCLMHPSKSDPPRAITTGSRHHSRKLCGMSWPTWWPCPPFRCTTFGRWWSRPPYNCSPRATTLWQSCAPQSLESQLDSISPFGHTRAPLWSSYILCVKCHCLVCSLLVLASTCEFIVWLLMCGSLVYRCVVVSCLSSLSLILSISSIDGVQELPALCAKPHPTFHTPLSVVFLCCTWLALQRSHGRLVVFTAVAWASYQLVHM
jgi:hypothetical protein